MENVRLADYILEHSSIENMADLSACAAIDVLRDWPRKGDVTYRFKDDSKLTMEAAGSATTN